MPSYKLNGTLLTKENGCLPSNNRVGYTPSNLVETVGGAISVESPSGKRRTYTWEYDGRSTTTMDTLLDLLGDNPVAIIDTPQNRRESGVDAWYENVVCNWAITETRSRGKRSDVDSFSLTFTEVQSS